jgi:hypothetical protein
VIVHNQYIKSRKPCSRCQPHLVDCSCPFMCMLVFSGPAATWNGWAIYYTFPLADGDAGVLCDSLFQGPLGLETPSDPILCLKASRLYTAPESCGLQVCHYMAGFTPDAHIMWSSMREMSRFQRCLLDIFHAYEQKSGVDAGS